MTTAPAAVIAGVVIGPGTAISGAVASRLKLTDCVAVPPALVAEHVSVMLAPSAATVDASQPVDDEIALCASATIQLPFTLLVYQPLPPSAPVTAGGNGWYTSNVNVSWI